MSRAASHDRYQGFCTQPHEGFNTASCCLNRQVPRTSLFRLLLRWKFVRNAFSRALPVAMELSAKILEKVPLFQIYTGMRSLAPSCFDNAAQRHPQNTSIS